MAVPRAFVDSWRKIVGANKTGTIGSWIHSMRDISREKNGYIGLISHGHGHSFEISPEVKDGYKKTLDWCILLTIHRPAVHGEIWDKSGQENDDLSRNSRF